MLHHEYTIFEKQLDSQPGDRTRFFVFADAVATWNKASKRPGHSSLGIRFQPRHSNNQTKLSFTSASRTKKYLTIAERSTSWVGTNLIYGDFCYHDEPGKLIKLLANNLGTSRVEVDILDLSGSIFSHILFAHRDKRLCFSLFLEKHGFTKTVIFIPTEVCYSHRKSSLTASCS